MLAFNPHITFWNGSSWGYGILTLTADKLVCDFKVVSTVKFEGATLQHLTTFTVPAGAIRLIQS